MPRDRPFAVRSCRYHSPQKVGCSRPLGSVQDPTTSGELCEWVLRVWFGLVCAASVCSLCSVQALEPFLKLDSKTVPMPQSPLLKQGGRSGPCPASCSGLISPNRKFHVECTRSLWPAGPKASPSSLPVLGLDAPGCCYLLSVDQEPAVATSSAGLFANNGKFCLRSPWIETIAVIELIRLVWFSHVAAI